jgi:DNA polymerase I-like protein with 3'-5' exonuclease and polymerase domains
VPIVHTEELRQGAIHGDPVAHHQLYCGLDSALTHEIWGEIRRTHPEPPIYSFERAMQAPYFEITARGFKIDEPARRKALALLASRRERLQAGLDRMGFAIWDKPVNSASPKQLQELFYSRMCIPEEYISTKGVRRVSTNREALEKIEEKYFHARPLVASILALRDVERQESVLSTGVDTDGRYRAGYNVAGTESGRASSSKNPWGTGGNGQNWAPGIRFVFTADPGWKFCVIDLEQVEARDVGWIIGCLFGDWKFLDNCEGGDLHTNNAKLIWPDLEWPGDPRGDRAVADRNFYREYSFRDMAKRGGHLTNYSGTAWTAARSLKVPLPIMTEFQARYCRGARGIDPAFPGIAQYWAWVAKEIQTGSVLRTAFGRERYFFGRPNDDATLREGIAYLPQSMTADRTNLGLWRVWRWMPEVQLLAQTHDSITFQYQDQGPASEEAIIRKALKLIEVTLSHPGGRRFTVPGEAKIGWNWGSRGKDGSNPEGLIKWAPKAPDARIRGTGIKKLIW